MFTAAGHDFCWQSMTLEQNVHYHIPQLTLHLLTCLLLQFISSLMQNYAIFDYDRVPDSQYICYNNNYFSLLFILK